MQAGIDLDQISALIEDAKYSDEEINRFAIRNRLKFHWRHIYSACRTNRVRLLERILNIPTKNPILILHSTTIRLIIYDTDIKPEVIIILIKHKIITPDLFKSVDAAMYNALMSKFPRELLEHIPFDPSKLLIANGDSLEILYQQGIKIPELTMPVSKTFYSTHQADRRALIIFCLKHGYDPTTIKLDASCTLFSTLYDEIAANYYLQEYRETICKFFKPMSWILCVALKNSDINIVKLCLEAGVSPNVIYHEAYNINIHRDIRDNANDSVYKCLSLHGLRDDSAIYDMNYIYQLRYRYDDLMVRRCLYTLCASPEVAYRKDLNVSLFYLLTSGSNISIIPILPYCKKESLLEYYNNASKPNALFLHCMFRATFSYLTLLPMDIFKFIVILIE